MIEIDSIRNKLKDKHYSGKDKHYSGKDKSCLTKENFANGMANNAIMQCQLHNFAF